MKIIDNSLIGELKKYNKSKIVFEKSNKILEYK
jgi:hypothetical protein